MPDFSKSRRNTCATAVASDESVDAISLLERMLLSTLYRPVWVLSTFM